jgi:hypothetical protein
MVFLAMMIIPGGVYYLETVLRGAQGAKCWSVSPINCIWIYYELIGAIGLGPPGFMIRDMAHEIISSGVSYKMALEFLYPETLCIGVMSLIILSLYHFGKEIKSLSLITILLLIFIFSVFFLLILSIILHKALWARHLAPLFPIYCLLLYSGLSFSINRIKKHPIFAIISGIVLILLVLSSLRFLFSAQYVKDNNRKAAMLAKSFLKNNETVWWAGSSDCAWYYGLPVSARKSTDVRFILLDSPEANFLSTLKVPDGTFLNKRYDVFDKSHAIRDYIINHKFRSFDDKLEVFDFWGKSSSR